MTNTGRDTVLIIDDDPDLRTLIAEIGEISGVPMLAAENCCEGLKVLERELPRIKLILLDYFMPGMTPSNCAKALQEKVKEFGIPIVLITAAVAPEERAAELNLSRWLGKPFELDHLKKILQTNEI